VTTTNVTLESRVVLAKRESMLRLFAEQFVASKLALLGLILLLLVEMVMHRDLSLTVKEAVFKVGFVFIMLIVAFVLYNDISRILPAG